jgi:hypothetical protein
MQEELAEHLAFQTEENVRAGMPPVEARRQAAINLGGAAAIREHHHAEQSACAPAGGPCLIRNSR